MRDRERSTAVFSTPPYVEWGRGKGGHWVSPSSCPWQHSLPVLQLLRDALGDAAAQQPHEEQQYHTHCQHAQDIVLSRRREDLTSQVWKAFCWCHLEAGSTNVNMEGNCIKSIAWEYLNLIIAMTMESQKMCTVLSYNFNFAFCLVSLKKKKSLFIQQVTVSYYLCLLSWHMIGLGVQLF